MHRLLTIILVSIFPLLLSAQNWQIIQPDDTLYFLSSEGELVALATIDTVHPSATEVSFDLIDAFWIDTTCRWPIQGGFLAEGYSIKAPIWAGRRIIEDVTGEYKLVNRAYEHIMLRTLDTVGAQWVYYSSTTGDIIASIINADTMTINGSLDSIKTIILSTNAIHILLTSWQDDTLVISKDHGIIQLTEIADFPQKHLLYHRTDQRPLTYREAYDLNVGDEYQFRTVDYFYTINNELDSTVYYDYYQVLNKSFVSSSSLSLNYYHERIKGSIITNDTIVDTISNIDQFIGRTLPGTYIQKNYNNSYYDFTTTRFRFSSFKLTNEDNILTLLAITDVNNSIEFGNDTCYYRAVQDGGIPLEYHISCLGSFSLGFSAPGSAQNRSITYLNTCGNTKGILLSSEDEQLRLNQQLTAYPNPANNYIHISELKPTDTVSLFNLQGEVVEVARTDKQLDVTALPNGIYLLRVETKLGFGTQKIVVQH